MSSSSTLRLSQPRSTGSTLDPRPSTRSAAFSLIELMIAMGLLTLVILGLMLMFNQVQKAFRSSMMQTDVLEGGRAIAAMVARDLEEMTPSQISYPTNSFPSPNFSVQMSAEFADPLLQFLPGTTLPDGSGPQRTNLIQQFFFMSRLNQAFVGTGYRVFPDFTNAAGLGDVGTLYRFSTNALKASALNMGSQYVFAAQSPYRMNRIADGVVHFKLRAYDTNGSALFMTNNMLSFWSTNYSLKTPWVGMTNTVCSADYIPGQTRYYCYSNAVPAYLELEIGFLEAHYLDRYRAIADANVAAGRNYLSNHVANVHIFRQRIPIRNVDYGAYQ